MERLEILQFTVRCWPNLTRSVSSCLALNSWERYWISTFISHNCVLFCSVFFFLFELVILIFAVDRPRKLIEFIIWNFHYFPISVSTILKAVPTFCTRESTIMFYDNSFFYRFLIMNLRFFESFWRAALKMIAFTRLKFLACPKSLPELLFRNWDC